MVNKIIPKRYKHEVPGKYMIDDSIHVYESKKLASWEPILVTQVWNKHIEAPNRLSVDTAI